MCSSAEPFVDERMALAVIGKAFCTSQDQCKMETQNRAAFALSRRRFLGLGASSTAVVWLGPEIAVAFDGISGDPFLVRLVRDADLMQVEF